MESISDNQTFHKHYSTGPKASDSLLNISIIFSQGFVGGLLCHVTIYSDLTNSISTKGLESSVITTPTGDLDRKWYLRRCVCVSIGGRAHLNLKVSVDVRKENHLFFIPQLSVISLNSPSDSPPLSAQTNQHLHKMKHSMSVCVCMCVSKMYNDPK